MSLRVDPLKVLFYGFAEELDEPLAVLIRVAGRNPVYVRAIFDSFGSFGSLFFDAVVGEHVYDGQKVYFLDGSVCNRRTARWNKPEI